MNKLKNKQREQIPLSVTDSRRKTLKPVRSTEANHFKTSNEKSPDIDGLTVTKYSKN